MTYPTQTAARPQEQIVVDRDCKRQNAQVMIVDQDSSDRDTSCHNPSHRRARLEASSLPLSYCLTTRYTCLVADCSTARRY